MDISSKALAETGTFDLVDADGDPIKNEAGKVCSITAYGPASREFQRAKSRHDRAVLATLGKKPGKEEADDGERERLADFLADVTISLNNFDYKGGTDRKAVRAMYADTSLLFIADKLNRDLGSLGNFTTPVAKK